MPKLPDDLIRQSDAAKLFQVSRQYIFKLVYENKVRSYTPAKLVSEREIRGFIETSRKMVDKVN